MCLDTLLTVLYCFIDDWCKLCAKTAQRPLRGRPQKMTDAEVLTLAVAAQWRGNVPWQSERAMVRYMHRHGRAWFPDLLQHSQFNLRLRQLWQQFIALQQNLAELLTDGDPTYEVVDCTPVRHCTLGQAISHRSQRLSGRKGRGGNDGGWYHGEQLLLCTTDKGIITGWMTGLADVDDRWMLQAFLSSRHGQLELVEPPLPPHRAKKERRIPTPESFSPPQTAGPARQPYFYADGGFNGQRWIEQWRREYGVAIIAPPVINKREQRNYKGKRTLSSRRQIVETVIARLVKTFDFRYINAHSETGMVARIAAKMAAYNLGVWANRLLNRPDGALPTLIC